MKNASDKLLATKKTETTEEIMSWKRSGCYETKMTVEIPENTRGPLSFQWLKYNHDKKLISI